MASAPITVSIDWVSCWRAVRTAWNTIGACQLLKGCGRIWHAEFRANELTKLVGQILHQLVQLLHRYRRVAQAIDEAICEVVETAAEFGNAIFRICERLVVLLDPLCEMAPVCSTAVFVWASAVRSSGGSVPGPLSTNCFTPCNLCFSPLFVRLRHRLGNLDWGCRRSIFVHDSLEGRIRRSLAKTAVKLLHAFVVHLRANSSRRAFGGMGR